MIWPPKNQKHVIELWLFLFVKFFLEAITALGFLALQGSHYPTFLPSLDCLAVCFSACCVSSGLLPLTWFLSIPAGFWLNLQTLSESHCVWNVSPPPTTAISTGFLIPSKLTHFEPNISLRFIISPWHWTKETTVTAKYVCQTTHHSAPNTNKCCDLSAYGPILYSLHFPWIDPLSFCEFC